MPGNNLFLMLRFTKVTSYKFITLPNIPLTQTTGYMHMEPPREYNKHISISNYCVFNFTK